MCSVTSIRHSIRKRIFRFKSACALAIQSLALPQLLPAHGANDFAPQVHCPTGYVLGVDAADTLCVSAAGAGASEAAGAASDVTTGTALTGASETAGAADSGCTSDVSDEAGCHLRRAGGYRAHAEEAGEVDGGIRAAAQNARRGHSMLRQS